MPKIENVLSSYVSGDPLPKLIPVFEAAAGQPQAQQVVVLSDDLLSDVLFGDVIDISDLIPQFLSPSDETTRLHSTDFTAAPTVSSTDGGDVLAPAGRATLTILYDDDILASDGTIL
jgi:hypothetical protein